MVSILLCGAGGKMGQVITQAVAQRSDCRIAAGIDPHAVSYTHLDVYKRQAR